MSTKNKNQIPVIYPTKKSQSENTNKTQFRQKDLEAFYSHIYKITLC